MSKSKLRPDARGVKKSSKVLTPKTEMPEEMPGKKEQPTNDVGRMGGMPVGKQKAQAAPGDPKQSMPTGKQKASSGGKEGSEKMPTSRSQAPNKGPKVPGKPPKAPKQPKAMKKGK